VREFGQALLTAQQEQASKLATIAIARLASAFADLNALEQRVEVHGYWACLKQVQAARDYAVLLHSRQATRLSQIERWLDRESYLLSDEAGWRQRLPGLFFQQLANRAVEEGTELLSEKAPTCWLQQLRRSGAESPTLLRILVGHADSVLSVAFSPDGRFVLTGSYDGTARLWDAISGQSLRTFKGHTNWVRSVAFSPDGRFVLTGSDDATARLWDAASGQSLRTFEGHTASVESVVFSPDGDLIITTDESGRVYFWRVSIRSDTEQGQERLIGLYVASYPVGAFHWQDATTVILADVRGPDGRSHLYYLKLHGME